MGLRIYRDTSGLKHQYAFDEWKNVVHILNAKDYLNGKKCRYFLDQELKEEILLRAGEKNQWHFSLKSEYFEFNGKKYLRDTVSESPQHYDAKLKIIGQGYFEWGEYKIPVKNCRIERRFGKSYFRADLIAQLTSGEKVFIEIIKTSDTSKSKEKYIIENQLPTFKLYIDNEGNFKRKEFDFIGNREIESIREEYRKQQYEFEESERIKKNAWRDYHQEKNRVESDVRTLEEGARDWFRRKEKEIEYSAIDDGRTFQIEIEKRRNKAFDIIKQIRSSQRNIKESRFKTNKAIQRIRQVRTSKQRLFDLLDFYDSFKYDKEISFDKCTLIKDVNKFIENHCSAIRANISNITYLPYYERLIKLKNLLA